MQKDQQGLALPGATPEAAALYCTALRAYNIYRGDPVGCLDAALEIAPDFHMAKVCKAHLHAVSSEPAAMAIARGLLDELKRADFDERAASHVRALDLLYTEGWHAAATALDIHNLRWPTDLLAVQTGHLIDFLRGSARNLRDRIARVLPQWSPDMPGYPVLLGMHAFGLEESGDYARAEDAGRRAVELEPLDGWAAHAVAHVMEMQGRAEEGIEWLHTTRSGWDGDDNFFKVHNWWHLAVFHMGLEQAQEALALYDARIRKDRSATALDLVDASALLWRLQLAGIDIGSRAAEAAEAWLQHADGRTYTFNDWHAFMSCLQAGWESEAVRLLKAVQRTAAGHGEAAEWARKAAVPLMEGFFAYWRKDDRKAVELLHPARYAASVFGGSHAQRDIIDLTLMKSALRGGMRDYAEALVCERLALKPHSPVNQRFLRLARAPRTALAQAA